MKSDFFLLFLNDRYYFFWRDGERISCELGIVKYLNALLFLIITMLLGKYYYYPYFSVDMKVQRG